MVLPPLQDRDAASPSGLPTPTCIGPVQRRTVEFGSVIPNSPEATVSGVSPSHYGSVPERDAAPDRRARCPSGAPSSLDWELERQPAASDRYGNHTSRRHRRCARAPVRRWHDKFDQRGHHDEHRATIPPSPLAGSGRAATPTTQDLERGHESNCGALRLLLDASSEAGVCADSFGRETPAPITVDTPMVTVEWMEDGTLLVGFAADSTHCGSRLMVESNGPAVGLSPFRRMPARIA